MCQIIREDDTLEIVGEADSAEQALELLEDESIEIDVAVVDIDLPGLNGLQLSARLQQRARPLPVVLLTMHKNEDLFNKAVEVGVSAYVLKDEAVEGVVSGIRRAAAGQSYVSPSLADFVMKRAARKSAEVKTEDALDSLTPMERKVLKRVAQQKSSKEIAAELFISPRTVGAHRNNIREKLDLKGKEPLLGFALANRDRVLGLPD